MEPVVRRKISEVIELYKLEPTLKDIYVEGICDKLIVESFLEKNAIKHVSIYEIDVIDFSDLYEKSPELKRNNKAKIIGLSEQLKLAHGNSLKFISCIADRDFDDLLGISYNKYLLFTDFTSFEMYLFNKKCINTFYKRILHTFPFGAQTAINTLSEPLKELFLIRYSFICLPRSNGQCDFIDIKKTCNIDKKTGQIRFDSTEFLKKMLHKLNLYPKKEKYEKHIESTRAKLPKDIRHTIRGHDFIHLFFLYINKIKNNIKINEETLERVFFMCIDHDELIKYNLFSSLLSKYS